MAVRCVGGGSSLGFGHLRPVGPEPPADVQGGRLADAPVPAGVVRLLLPGHGGIQSGHLQWLRGGSERAPGADKRSQRGLEEKGFKDVEHYKEYVETLKKKLQGMHGPLSYTSKCMHLWCWSQKLRVFLLGMWNVLDETAELWILIFVSIRHDCNINHTEPALCVFIVSGLSD